ncbi:MAG: carboxypeptidase-like regulatory domain-containing protein [Ignavibacteria bacterium]|nr:carboxypeptidase-like regulatory domain-containing protein [Ignavibacteria bacterium]
MARSHFLRTLPVVLLLVSFAIPLIAGDAKISGNVTNSQDGKAILANVTIENTRLGAATDTSGFFTILNVPPGTYQIRASAVGYGSKVIQDITAGADQSLRLDFDLRPVEVGMEEIVVHADRSPIDQSQTTSQSTFGGNEVNALPIRSVNAALATAPSTFRAFVRGGFPFSTQTVVDGIDITDNYAGWYSLSVGLVPYGYNSGVQNVVQADRSASIDLTMESVDQATLFTGAYGADYGGTSGAIAYSLREGRGRWSGNARVRMSQMGGLKHFGPDVYNDQQQYFLKKEVLEQSLLPNYREYARFYTWTPGKYEYGNKPEVSASFGLGGSVSDEVGLHMSGSWFDSHGRLPNEWTRRLNSSLKLTFNPSQSVRVNALALLEDRGRLLGWKNRVYSEVWRYFLEGVPQWDGYNIVGSVKLTHTLSPTASYEVQASITQDNMRRGFCDDNNDGLISLGEDGEFLTWADTAQVYRYMSRPGMLELDKFFKNTSFPGGVEFQPSTLWLVYPVAHPNIYYDDFTQSVGTLRLSGSALVHPGHLLQVGAEARFHVLDKTLRAGPGGSFPQYKNYVEEIWTRRPKEFNFYLMDKMEFKDLYVNLGLRAEVVDLDARESADWYAPYAAGVDESGGPILYPVRGESVPPKVFLSPRIGVSHPINDDAAMYFSFSRSQRQLPYSVLYSNYDNYANYEVNFRIPVSQDPITSSEYDLGVQWSIFQNAAVTIGAFYRDYQNYRLLGVRTSPTSGLYTLIATPGMFVDVRGVELELNQKPVSLLGFLRLSGRFAYSLSSVMQGKPVHVKNQFSAAAGDSALYGGGVPFGDVRYWDKTYEHIPGGSFLLGGYDRKHRATFQLFMEFPFDIRANAIGRFSSGFYFAAESQEAPDYTPIEGPWNKQVDLRLEKGFRLEGIGRLSLFVDVINLFNWVNIVSFQYATFQSAVTSQEGKRVWEVSGDPTGGPGINRPTTPENVLVYDVPREVYFGLSFEF